MCKSKLGTEKGGEHGSAAGGEGGVKGGEDRFKEVQECLNISDGGRDTGVKNVAVMTKMRM